MKFRTEHKTKRRMSASCSLGEALAKEYAKRFPEQVKETLNQLAAYDSNPCSWCGTVNNKHSHLYGKEIKRKRELGNAVLICEGPAFPVGDENLLEITWLMFRCVVTPAPENPCDSDFMEDIST